MKSLSIVWALVSYNLRLLPWFIWPLVAVISLFSAWTTELPADDAWTVSDITTTRLSGNWFFVCAVIGACFFGIRSRYEGGQIPDGEFLLSRPILRRTAYFSRVVFLFVLMLMPPLSVIYAERTNPDLRVDFFHWTEPNAIAGQIQFYQKQFPNNSVVHKVPHAFEKNTYVATIMIPSGRLLVAFWDLFVVIVLTLVLQLAMFFRSPANARFSGLFVTLAGVYFLAELALLVMFPSLGVRPTPYEHGFFLFAHHRGWFVVFTLEAFIFVQGIALKRIQSFEVV
jgi:hypothetical protein